MRTMSPVPHDLQATQAVFTTMSTAERVRSIRIWLKRLTRWATRLLKKRQDRFVILTPALLCRQLIADRDSGQRHELWIRDTIDAKVIEQIFISQDYAFGKLRRHGDIEAYYKNAVAQGRTPLIVDCGANCGMATKYFAATYPQAHVVGIEPDLGNCTLARRNNPGPGVTLRLAAVGASDSRGSLVDPQQGHWAYQVRSDAGGALEIVSINSILAEPAHSGMLPFVVKIDIEGFEANLFEHNTEWIDRFPVLIIELHDWMLPRTANARNFLRQIAARDRDFVYHGENVFSLSNTLM
jgi:FkbM family methyltransferase